MIAPPPSRTNPNAAPGRTPAVSRKPLVMLAAILAFLLVILALALWREALEGFFKTNYLYHLGHNKQWSKALEYLSHVPGSARRSPRYNLVKMHIFLNLSRTSDAMQFLNARPLDVLSPGDKNRIAFEQLGGFGLVLVGKEEEAADEFQKHPRNPLSVAMVALINQVHDSHPGAASPLPDLNALLALIEKETTFPQLYKHAAQYLFARGHIQRGGPEEAVEPLQEACAQYPFYPIFHRCLARAYLAQRRYDLATLHLTIARNQMQDTHLHSFSEADETSFETIVLQDALTHAETYELSNFWRLLRGLRHIFPETLQEPPALVNPHPMSLAEIWEWGVLWRDFYKERAEDSMPRGLAPADLRLFQILEQATESPPVRPLEIFLEDDPASAGMVSRFLAITAIHRRETLIATNSEPLLLSVPFPTEYAGNRILDQVLLFRLRASERQGVAGGCEVRLGQDSYWIYGDKERQWYGVPFPALRHGEIPLLFRLHHHIIPGYSDPGRKGHRSLYISTILLCTLYERKSG